MGRRSRRQPDVHLLLARRPGVRAPPPRGPHRARIGRSQWIDAQEDDDFDVALATILQALGTDPEWLEAHARLVIRATQWKAAGGGRSGLLHGQELRWAEDWLERGAELGQPTITDDQRELMSASRRAATSRRRMAVGGAAGAFALVAAAVLIVAAAQRRAADERRVSESIRLAENAVAQLPRDPELGRLLAIAAFDRSATPQAVTALRRAERAPFGARDRLILAHTSSTVRVVASGDGARLVELRRPDERIFHAVMSPNGRNVATTGSDNVVRVYSRRARVDRDGRALRARVRAQVRRELREAEEERYLREAAG